MGRLDLFDLQRYYRDRSALHILPTCTCRMPVTASEYDTFADTHHFLRHTFELKECPEALCSGASTSSEDFYRFSV